MNDPGDSTPIIAAITIAAVDDGSDSEPPERLSVVVVHEAGDWSAFPQPQHAVDRVAAALVRHPATRSARGAEAAVVLADDRLVQTLNKTFRGKDKPTNVLSFPFQAPPGVDADRTLGDVILAAETVRSEAAERDIPPDHHLHHLVLHGLLHLLGFDHETDAEAEDMERLETEILAGLGIADPHAATAIV